MASNAEIIRLVSRYPFSEDEMEILLRCHKILISSNNDASFLNQIAHSFPYTVFFLPHDEIENRVKLIEGEILPVDFGLKFHDAIFTDAFVDFANEGGEPSLEHFIEGIADCGRRGQREALRVIFDCCTNCNKTQMDPEYAIDLCYRLSIASEVLVSPSIDETDVKASIQIKKKKSMCMDIAESLLLTAENRNITKRHFIEWAASTLPSLFTTLSTFVHNLLFHRSTFPENQTPHRNAYFNVCSSIISSKSPLLFLFGCISSELGGKWHRLYSSESDGRSLNRLEWSLLGFDGPTIMLIQTQTGAVMGGFAASGWKAGGFHGNGGCFLFQLDPSVKIYRALNQDHHYMYCNSREKALGLDHLPHGIGFGGTLDRPRLFISEWFDDCTAGNLDSTYQPGDLIPSDALEKFKVGKLEIWSIGGDDAFQHGLTARAEYRSVSDSSIHKARKVTDKSQFVEDLSSGLIQNKVYSHREQARGRSEFQVDENHGGYKLERD